jgi:hypothetical protein
MKVTALWFAAFMLGIAGLVYGQTPAGASESKAQSVLAAAREAAGGEKNLSSISALELSGEYRRILNGREQHGALTADLALPDKYKSSETIENLRLGSYTDIRAIGAGHAWIASVSNSPKIVVETVISDDSDPATEQAALNARVGAEFYKYLLAFLLTPPAQAQVTFAGQAVAPQGRAQVIDVKNTDGFAVRLFFDVASHRLLMMTGAGEEAPKTVFKTVGKGKGRQSTGQASGAGDGTEAAGNQGKALESRLFFSDYRQVEGVWFPFQIRLTEPGSSGEIRLTKVVVNPQLAPKAFDQPSK